MRSWTEEGYQAFVGLLIQLRCCAGCAVRYPHSGAKSLLLGVSLLLVVTRTGALTYNSSAADSAFASHFWSAFLRLGVSGRRSRMVQAFHWSPLAGWFWEVSALFTMKSCGRLARCCSPPFSRGWLSCDFIHAVSSAIRSAALQRCHFLQNAAPPTLIRPISHTGFMISSRLFLAADRLHIRPAP